MIVNRAGIIKILDYYKKHPIFLPFDMEYTRPEGIRLIACNRDIVTTRLNAESDNGCPHYRIRKDQQGSEGI
jgi:hypothetical protein